MGTALRNIMTALSEGMEKQDMEMLLERIDRLTQKLDRELADFVLEVSIRANRKILFMRDQENIEKGMEKGLKKGKAEGIIELGLDLGFSENEILDRLQVKLGISLQEAQEYLLDYKNEICMNP